MSVRTKFLMLLAGVALASLTYYLFSMDRSRDLVLVGTVDSNQVIVGAQVQGRVQRLLVDEGSKVTAGDLLAVLDPSELEEERRAAAATLASLRNMVSVSRFTQLSTQGSTAGDVGDARAKLESVGAQLQQAKATLAGVESNSTRTVELARKGIVSDQDRIQAEANLKAQQASVQSLMMQVEAARADLESALARTNQATAAQGTVASTRGQMANAEAALRAAEVRLGYTRIRAPVSGTVSVRAVREGEVLSAGAPVLTLVDLRDTWVRAAVPETEADRVGLGDMLTIRLPGGGLRRGKVFFKAVEEDFATQRDVSRRKRDIKTLVLKVRLDNPDGAFVPGMTAEVILPAARLGGEDPSRRGPAVQP